MLIVDDNQDLLKLWTKVFGALGHQVATACDALEAARLLTSLCPEVVVTDLRLPNLGDGLGLVRAAVAPQVSAKVVVIAGWPEDIRGRPEEKLISRLLVKPVQPSVLIRAVAELSGAA